MAIWHASLPPESSFELIKIGAIKLAERYGADLRFCLRIDDLEPGEYWDITNTASLQYRMFSSDVPPSVPIAVHTQMIFSEMNPHCCNFEN